MESVYIQSKYINHIFVHGCSLKSSTVAIVVPDEPSVKFWAESRGIPSLSLSVLCNNKELKVVIILWSSIIFSILCCRCSSWRNWEVLVRCISCLHMKGWVHRYCITYHTSTYLFTTRWYQFICTQIYFLLKTVWWHKQVYWKGEFWNNISSLKLIWCIGIFHNSYVEINTN